MPAHSPCAQPALRHQHGVSHVFWEGGCGSVRWGPLDLCTLLTCACLSSSLLTGCPRQRRPARPSWTSGEFSSSLCHYGCSLPLSSLKKPAGFTVYSLVLGKRRGRRRRTRRRRRRKRRKRNVPWAFGDSLRGFTLLSSLLAVLSFPPCNRG